MEDSPSTDELKPRLAALFYSVAAIVFDALILYFFVLSGGSFDPSQVLMTFILIGLLFPCVAGIVVSLFFWERKNIFVYSMILYGLAIFAGSVYYIYLLSSIDVWGILFALIGLIVMYFAIRHVRQSRSEWSPHATGNNARVQFEKSESILGISVLGVSSGTGE